MGKERAAIAGPPRGVAGFQPPRGSLLAAPPSARASRVGRAGGHGETDLGSPGGHINGRKFSPPSEKAALYPSLPFSTGSCRPLVVQQASGCGWRPWPEAREAERCQQASPAPSALRTEPPGPPVTSSGRFCLQNRADDTRPCSRIPAGALGFGLAPPASRSRASPPRWPLLLALLQKGSRAGEAGSAACPAAAHHFSPESEFS